MHLKMKPTDRIKIKVEDVVLHLHYDVLAAKFVIVAQAHEFPDEGMIIWQRQFEQKNDLLKDEQLPEGAGLCTDCGGNGYTL